MRLLRWLLGLLVLAAAAWVFFALPFGGRTFWERLHGATPAVSAPSAPPADRATTEGAATDSHTDEERQALERLLQEKLRGVDGGEAGR